MNEPVSGSEDLHEKEDQEEAARLAAAREVEEGEAEREEKISETAYIGPDLRPAATSERELGDFTTTPATLRLVPLAVLIGVFSAAISLALLDMIGFFTNLLYYQRISVHLTSPNANTLGAIAMVIPVGGGLLVGLMARFGSEQIRGHGIPEAMENILINGSKVLPRLAILKPISSAISIGTGGPFGAEGPIILTGGAVGSIVGQLFRFTAVERRSLLVAGASAGMSAVFGTPVAATLFGVELLVFELKPRSMVLIGIASATADALRIVMANHHLVSPQPLFPVPHHAYLTGVVLAGAAVVGIANGFAAWLLTEAVYTAEDLFMRLRPHLHWMWWPILGGVIIGVGGLIDSRALGVGYNTIHAELLGKLGVGALLLLFFVKLVIWAGSLGGGTSGGILAPILMMGAAVGALLGHVLPGASPGTWALIGMAGGLGGVTRSPFTAIVFAFELTGDQGSLLALLIAACLSHLVSVLILKRSILTEKVARRGFHVMREYSVDPLEAVFVREVMATEVYTTVPDQELRELYETLGEGSPHRRQRLYPVVHDDRLVGVLPWSAVLAGGTGSAGPLVSDVMLPPTLVTYPDETLQAVADQMASSGVGVIPVVSREAPDRLDGLVTQFELLRGRQKLLEEERRAERVLLLRGLSSRRTGVVMVGPEGPDARVPAGELAPPGGAALDRSEDQHPEEGGDGGDRP
ncbi:MAG: chloride channel protein [Acidimicrobiales bacterium]